jgi:hypothetical protein
VISSPLNDENTEFYRAQLFYKLLPELHTKHRRDEPAFWGLFSLFIRFGQKGDLFPRELAALGGEVFPDY